MYEDINARPIANWETVHYQCSRCGKCCRNIRDRVMLEAQDAFRLVKHLQERFPDRAPEELLSEYTEPRLLSRGYFIFLLKTVNDSGVCVFPENKQEAFNRHGIAYLMQLPLESLRRGVWD